MSRWRSTPKCSAGFSRSWSPGVTRAAATTRPNRSSPLCREALKAHLRDTYPDEPPSVLAAFVEERDAAELRRPEGVLAALRVRVCDPACGSGAYLLGMLHELVALRQALFASRAVDAGSTYARKLEIIQ